MAIQGPNCSFSENDKRLVRLLERLLLTATNSHQTSNIPEETVSLSDEEARELTSRIDATLESKEFWQASHLIGTLSNGKREVAREIYLGARAKHGFSRIMASTHYHQFLVRLGYEKSYLPGVKEMNFEYFVRMEKRLYLQLGVQPEIVALLERFLWTHMDQVDAARKGHMSIDDSLLINSLRSLRPQLDRRGSLVGGVLTANRVAGALTLFTNMTVMFTTRDWTVTGTMSAMAGAFGLTLVG